MEKAADAKIAEEIARAVGDRIGRAGDDVTGVIREEIQRALQGLGESKPAPPAHAAPSKIVVSANGRNRPSIVHALARTIDEFEGDIRDISQTIVGDHFTMIFVVELSDANADGSRFMQLKERLRRTGEDLGIHVMALHDDILQAMHTV